jgi:hypothetical protein
MIAGQFRYRHPFGTDRFGWPCPFLGAKPTSCLRARISEFDPERDRGLAGNRERATWDMVSARHVGSEKSARECTSLPRAQGQGDNLAAAVRKSVGCGAMRGGDTGRIVNAGAP